jgi:hypothetical protein
MDWDITTPELKAAWQHGTPYPRGETYNQSLGEQE